ncbi:GAF domain-containing sensor histidine kinase [Ferruginibacter albus]|uniref:GAF domain-containing sensor histidine kinase n=1 Tax=Ferruginibacter albus TaxID=2875540 RepID=UPI001CC4C3D0|nr:GAF domain-containing sensor histidine kinase [Ferruginibacter albus]UAY52843.1 GAF domain-containing sensor histidine kinase [Ferruginibacter albus]
MIDKESLEIQDDIIAINSIEGVNTILQVVCLTTGMGFSTIARVTKKKWVACVIRDEINFGLKAGGELVLESTICHEIEQSHQAVIIEHVATDPVFANHHTPLQYGFQSYISMPIVLKNGDFFGTLCAIDPQPNDLKNPKIIGMFQLFAKLISMNLDSVRELANAEAKLLEEQQLSELREQFIAILSHDLRNPVGATLNSAQMIHLFSKDEQVLKLSEVILRASHRIKVLVDNVNDFAKARLGAGINLNYDEGDIEKTLKEIINEHKMISKHAKFDTQFNITKPISYDANRIGQLFSNLLSNAIAYSKDEKPIKIKADIDADKFILSVSNASDKIPDAIRARLFQPFFRGEAKPNSEGLGLGLYICSQIAKAHKGSLVVESDNDQTCFTLKIPTVLN